MAGCQAAAEISMGRLGGRLERCRAFRQPWDAHSTEILSVQTPAIEWQVSEAAWASDRELVSEQSEQAAMRRMRWRKAASRGVGATDAFEASERGASLMAQPERAMQFSPLRVERRLARRAALRLLLARRRARALKWLDARAELELDAPELRRPVLEARAWPQPLEPDGLEQLRLAQAVRQPPPTLASLSQPRLSPACPLPRRLRRWPCLENACALVPRARHQWNSSGFSSR